MHIGIMSTLQASLICTYFIRLAVAILQHTDYFEKRNLLLLGAFFKVAQKV